MAGLRYPLRPGLTALTCHWIRPVTAVIAVTAAAHTHTPHTAARDVLTSLALAARTCSNRVIQTLIRMFVTSHIVRGRSGEVLIVVIRAGVPRVIQSLVLNGVTNGSGGYRMAFQCPSGFLLQVCITTTAAA